MISEDQDIRIAIQPQRQEDSIMNKPYITRLHVVLEILALLLCIASLVLAVLYALNSDGPVPTNYDFKGNVTGWGSPWTALVMPIVALAMVIADALVLHLVPASSWNTGFKVRPAKANAVYREIGLMVVLLSVEFAMFALAFTVFLTLSKADLFGSAAILLAVVMTVTIILTLVRAGRKNKY